MPCENEIKMVLRHSDALYIALTTQYGWHDITQGYLNNNCRLRQITHQSGLVDHVFSYKQRLPNGRNIEIESCDVTQDDFNALWGSTDSRLFKRRVSKFINEGPLIRWDIDFPIWQSGARYFNMAEVEMPPEMDHPPFLLDDIAQYVVYEVPRSDNRFSARKLSDEKHAKKLMKELGLE